MSGTRRHRFLGKAGSVFNRGSSMGPAETTGSALRQQTTEISSHAAEHIQAATPSTSTNGTRSSSQGGVSKSPPAAIAIQPRVQHGQRIFDTAVGALEEEDQNTIRGIVVGQDVDGIKAARDAVLLHQRRCEEERWSITVIGCTIGLGQVAAAVSSLLDLVGPGIDLLSEGVHLIQPGIDIAAELDPLHIGVPVAVVRAVLGVVVFSSAQMDKLLAGVKVATYMLRQLSLYFEYFKQVRSPAAATNLEDILASSYAIVLEFLAIGYRALQKKGPRKAWELLWTRDKVDGFEASCKDASLKLELAANLCHRESNQVELTAVKKSMEEALSHMKQLDIVAVTVQALHEKVDLTKLTPAGAASHKYVDHDKSSDPDKNQKGTLFDYCLTGTRTRLVEEMASWCHQSHQTIFWLRGMAGTGKSTLIRTVAKRVEEEGLLVASFFFKQDAAEQSHGKLFVQTIVVQLMSQYPLLRRHVADALASDLILPGGPMSNQFSNLLMEPLTKAGIHKLVLVIDALDECFASDAVIILNQLVRLATKLDVRVVITSRPEQELETAFQAIKPESIRLEEVKEEEVTHDLRVFLQTCFAGLVEQDANGTAPQLTSGWPGDTTIEQLVQMTKPLFIFAATLFRYVSDYKPKESLTAIIQETRNGTLDDMQRVYLPVLRQVYRRAKAQRMADFKIVVGAIVTLRDPLSSRALSGLLGMPLPDLVEVLKPLHSVLSVPDDLDAQVRVLHKSFKDFLLESKHDFTISTKDANHALLQACLRLLSRLKKDICSVTAPGTRRRDFTREGEFISPEMKYACIYWVIHINDNIKIKDNGQIHQFLRQHFLHWFEALSWLDKLSVVAHTIQRLQPSVQFDESPELAAFLDDALRFFLVSRHIVDDAPLQLYHSALVFAPKSSLVRSGHQHESSASFDLLPDVVARWSAERQKLEGHEDWVSSVVFSHDGKLLASASYDKTVRVWDAATGEERQKLEGHEEGVSSVVFSHDGKLLASASYDKTVRVWDAATGEERQKLEGHEEGVSSVVFSHDGKLLASASYDKTVRVWDAATGEERQKLEGHDNYVNSVVFSHDGKLLASASYDKTVRVWDAATGEERQKLEGHEEGVSSVVFSYDGKLLASASHDKTVLVWDAATGEERQKLEGHDDYVNSVVFSHDGKLLASASHDKTVRVWDAATGEERQKLEGHDDYVNSVVFSHDGKLLASASYDKTVRVWDAATGEERQKLEGHDDYVNSVVFSHDGKLLASASYDKTVRVWDAATGEERQKLEGHDDYVNSVVFSHDGKLLASASYDKTVRVWDAATGEERQKLEGHDDYVNSVVFSHDGKLLASASYDKTVRVWDAATGEERQKLEGHEEGVSSVAFSPDGKLLASASRDKTVRVWDAATGEERQKLEGHDNYVNSVVFSHDGKLLASASYDKTVRVWDAATGEERQKLEGQYGMDPSVAFLDAGDVLRTKAGHSRLDFNENAAASTEIGIQGRWIRWDGRDILWLPHEYRESCSAVFGKTLVVGHPSGAVSFFRK